MRRSQPLPNSVFNPWPLLLVLALACRGGPTNTETSSPKDVESSTEDTQTNAEDTQTDADDTEPPDEDTESPDEDTEPPDEDIETSWDHEISTPLYWDLDGDSFGGALADTESGANTTQVSGDCDDEDPLVNPATLETCDGVDQDCDGAVDEEGPEVIYIDHDGDGYGEDASQFTGCVTDASHVLVGGDCDDFTPDVCPGCDEYCDQIDNDCDGDFDEHGLDATSWFPDMDGDGYGDGSVENITCSAPSADWISVDGDCDDGDEDSFPGGTEVCDTGGADEDCDGDVDCDDSDCVLSCPENDCGDGIDDDGDGLVDCEDGDCENACQEGGDDSCTNGLDDDLDGDFDCQDADCWGRQGCMVVTSRITSGKAFVALANAYLSGHYWPWRKTYLDHSLQVQNIVGSATVSASSSTWSCSFSVKRAHAAFSYLKHTSYWSNTSIVSSSSPIQRTSTSTWGCGVPASQFLPSIVQWPASSPSVLAVGTVYGSTWFELYQSTSRSSWQGGSAWPSGPASTIYRDRWYNMDLGPGESFFHFAEAP